MVTFMGFLRHRGEHPPCTYPVRGSRSSDLIIDSDFSPTLAAAFFRSRLPVTGTRKT